MKIKHNSAELISSDIVRILKSYDVEVLIERNDSTKIMTKWAMFITYYYELQESAELTFYNAFVFDDATGRKLHEVSLSDEEFATLKEYVSLEYNIDSYLDHKWGG